MHHCVPAFFELGISNHDEEDNEVEDPNDEDITEDNYSTMMDLGSEDPDDEAANLIDFVDE